MIIEMNEINKKEGDRAESKWRLKENNFAGTVNFLDYAIKQIIEYLFFVSIKKMVKHLKSFVNILRTFKNISDRDSFECIGNIGKYKSNRCNVIRFQFYYTYRVFITLKAIKRDILIGNRGIMVICCNFIP